MIKQNKFHKKASKHINIINDFFIDAINPSEEAAKCRSLWMHVIEQAVNDILSMRFGMRYKLLRNKAVEWIFYDNENFYEICYLAEINPGNVRENVLSILKSRQVPNSFEQQFAELLKSIDINKSYVAN